MKFIDPDSICKKCAGQGKVVSEGKLRFSCTHMNCVECQGTGIIENLEITEEELNSEAIYRDSYGIDLNDRSGPPSEFDLKPRSVNQSILSIDPSINDKFSGGVVIDDPGFCPFEEYGKIEKKFKSLPQFAGFSTDIPIGSSVTLDLPDKPIKRRGRPPASSKANINA